MSEDDEVPEESGILTTELGGLAFGRIVDGGPEAAAARRPHVRMLVAICAVGAAVALACAVTGIVVVRHYLDDRSSVGVGIAAKYQRLYRLCVESGGDRADCGTQARQECAADPDWRSQANRITEISARCRFGPATAG